MSPLPLPRLRQVALITRDPAPVESALDAVLGLALDHRYPGVDEFGLGAAWFPIGNEFLEVVTAATRGTSADRFVERRGEGGFAVMLECADLPAVRRRARGARLRVVGETESPGHGRRIQFHPKDTGGTFLELHELSGAGVTDPDGPWPYASDIWRAARRTEVVRGLVGAEIQCEDPDVTAYLWSTLLDLPMAAVPGGGTELTLRGGRLRFTRSLDGRGPGLGGIDVQVADREALVTAARKHGCARHDALLEIGGLRVYLVD
jgi:catechol 2,3-dioxygenase-like lactoylglutathione lyase family enzyme